MANRNYDRDDDRGYDRDKGGRSYDRDDRSRPNRGRDDRDDDRDRGRSSSRGKGKDGEKPLRVVTPVVRMSYEHVWKPWAGKNPKPGEEPKYQFLAMIKNADADFISKIDDMVDRAIDIGRKRWPERDWDSKRLTVPEFTKAANHKKFSKDPAFKGCTVVTLKSKTKPRIVDADLEEITDQSDVYSGCYVKAEITIYPYNGPSYYGVTIGLNHIMKIKDGEPLGGGAGDPADVEWGDTSADDFDDDDRDDDRRGGGRSRRRDDDDWDDDRRGSRGSSRRGRDDDYEDDRDDDRGRGSGRGRRRRDDDEDDDLPF